MKELLEYIVKALVDKPEAVSVNEAEKDGGLVLELRVDPDDMGKVIGKQGRIAKAMRTIIKTAAIRDNIRVTVDIID
ncbi:MAG: KH domain-containing protein [Clostridia bacterium]|nr:KH domain-containing protein [Clostridia bacterium]